MHMINKRKGKNNKYKQFLSNFNIALEIKICDYFFASICLSNSITIYLSYYLILCRLLAKLCADLLHIKHVQELH